MALYYGGILSLYTRYLYGAMLNASISMYKASPRSCCVVSMVPSEWSFALMSERLHTIMFRNPKSGMFILVMIWTDYSGISCLGIGRLGSYASDTDVGRHHGD